MRRAPRLALFTLVFIPLVGCHSSTAEIPWSKPIYRTAGATSAAPSYPGSPPGMICVNGKCTPIPYKPGSMVVKARDVSAWR